MIFSTTLIISLSIGFSTIFSTISILTTSLIIVSGCVVAWVYAFFEVKVISVPWLCIIFGSSIFLTLSLRAFISAHLSLSPCSIPLASSTNYLLTELAKSSMAPCNLSISGDTLLYSEQQAV